MTFVFLLIMVVYLSWKPNPSMAQAPMMPVFLGRWFDDHDFAKNLIGYGVFGFSGFLAWAKPMTHHKSTQSRIDRWSANHFMLLVCFCLAVVVLELGQLVLPYRTCDWTDVLAGWTGILLAWALFQLARLLMGGQIQRSGVFQSNLGEPGGTD